MHDSNRLKRQPSKGIVKNVVVVSVDTDVRF